MQQIGKILHQALAKKGLLIPATSAQICFYAEEWAKGRFRAVSFSRGILKVSVRSSCAASELQIEEEKLIEYVNKRLGRGLVRRLRIMNYF